MNRCRGAFIRSPSSEHHNFELPSTFARSNCSFLPSRMPQRWYSSNSTSYLRKSGATFHESSPALQGAGQPPSHHLSRPQSLKFTSSRRVSGIQTYNQSCSVTVEPRQSSKSTRYASRNLPKHKSLGRGWAHHTAKYIQLSTPARLPPPPAVTSILAERRSK